jgi:hypothetical protein
MRLKTLGPLRNKDFERRKKRSTDKTRKKEVVKKIKLEFFLSLWGWSLNLGLLACKAGTRPLQ